jgi:hypothetical protein
MAKVKQLSEPNTAKSTVAHYDTATLLSCVALSIAFVIVVYLAFMWPGTTPGEFALMTVFP